MNRTVPEEEEAMNGQTDDVVLQDAVLALSSGHWGAGEYGRWRGAGRRS
jgi:hypothetical protein